MSLLFKIVTISSLVTLLTGVITIMPDATALPTVIQSAITWLVTNFYFIDPIFPVSQFFVVIVYMINGFLTFITLVGLKKLIRIFTTIST